MEISSGFGRVVYLVNNICPEGAKGAQSEKSDFKAKGDKQSHF